MPAAGRQSHELLLEFKGLLRLPVADRSFRSSQYVFVQLTSFAFENATLLDILVY
jgi:hypothetical protein